MMYDQKEKINHSNNEDPRIKFMLAEYQGMSKALSDLYPVLMKMMNYFFMVAAVPISYVIYLGQDSGNNFNLGNMRITLIIVFAIISIAGFLFSLILINVRMGMRKYARAISLIRKFFIDYGNSIVDISPYIYMPATEKEPEYFKRWGFLLWQVLLIALFDAVYLAIVSKNIGICSWWFCVFIGFLYLLLHGLIYRKMANYREREDERRFKKHLERYGVNSFHNDS